MSDTTYKNQTNIEIDIHWEGPGDAVTLMKHGLSQAITSTFVDIIDDAHVSITTVTLTLYRPTLTGTYQGYTINSWWVEDDDQQGLFGNTFPAAEPHDPSYRTHPFSVPSSCPAAYSNSWNLFLDIEPSQLAVVQGGPMTQRLKLVTHDPIFKIKRQSDTRRD